MSAPTPSSHRLGARTDYLKPLGGARAPWSALSELAERPVLDDESIVRFSVRRRDPETARSQTANLSLSELADLCPDDLAEVRRPASYRGMRNYIGRMPLPSARHEAHAAWFESRNEQENFRELLIRRPVTQMVTQPMRIEWVIHDGIRAHVPDALYRDNRGKTFLIDVTRRKRLTDWTARAVFAVTALTTRALGWGYELRVELPTQYRRNVAFVYSHRHAAPDSRSAWAQRVRELPHTMQLAEAAALLGNDGTADLQALFHLVATRRLFMDLQQRLVSDSTDQRHFLPERSTPWLVQL